MKTLAIDLGGTSAKIALFDHDKILKRWQVPTKKRGIWQNIKDNLTDLKDEEYDVVSIAMTGFIDHKTGIIVWAENLDDLRDYDARADASKVFGNKMTYVINDANAAALGEYWKGSAKDDESTIFYTIGTGIGGGIVMNGQLIYGVRGMAGEFGHCGDFQTKYKCICGQKACIEPLSSAIGITKLLKENGFDITVKEAGVMLNEGNKEIEKIFRTALKPLAVHMAIMEMALNPESIIIGGGPSAIGEPLRKIIEDLVNENCLDFIAEATKIKLAETKNDAGIYGAAFWALQQEGKL